MPLQHFFTLRNPQTRIRVPLLQLLSLLFTQINNTLRISRADDEYIPRKYVDAELFSTCLEGGLGYLGCFGSV